MKILTLITLCNAELRSFFFKLVFFFRWSLVAIVRSLFGYHYSQGPRTQGGRGARAPLKIGDLYSKFFGKRQNLIFLFIRAPLRKKSFLGPWEFRQKVYLILIYQLNTYVLYLKLIIVQV